MTELDGAQIRPRERQRRRNSTGRFVRDILIIFLAAILISFLVKTFLFRSFYIPSGSMMNTLQIDDRVIVDELVPDVQALKRGDVVVFQDPGGWLGPEDRQVSHSTGNSLLDGLQAALTAVGLGTQDSDDHLIKRVIGLPGDRVACCDAEGKDTVNGVALTEPYIDFAGNTAASRDPFSVTVPEGSIWVEGDNRYDSADSRYHQDLPSKGFVPLTDVVGRAVVITWPASRWSWLDDYGSTFADVPDPKR